MGGQRKSWKLASTIVHETAHQEYYKKVLGGEIDVTAVGNLRKESDKYAYTEQIVYLVKLRDAGKPGTKNANIHEIDDEISALTKRLTEERF
jgi:hypothetical protein